MHPKRRTRSPWLGLGMAVLLLLACLYVLQAFTGSGARGVCLSTSVSILAPVDSVALSAGVVPCSSLPVIQVERELTARP